MVMKKLLAVVVMTLGFSVAAAIPNVLAIGFVIEGIGVNVISKLLAAILAVLFFVFGFAIDPLVA